MRQNKIFIITPAYQSAAHIEKCILSVMTQDYTNYEHIIVDGGSTDGTLDILRKYEGKYPMRWISEKDNGMYDAINKGFAMASGDIFAWLNSDDVFLPWAFRTMNTVMQREDIAWCTCGPAFFADERDNFFFLNRSLGPRSFSQKLIRKGWHDGVRRAITLPGLRRALASDRAPAFLRKWYKGLANKAKKGT